MTALLVGCAAEERPPLERKYHPEVLCVFIIVLFRFALDLEPLFSVRRGKTSLYLALPICWLMVKFHL